MVPLPSFSSLHCMNACRYKIYLFIACLLSWKIHSMKSETLSCLSLYPLYPEQCPAPSRPSINLLSKLDIPGTSELSFPQGAAACLICTLSTEVLPWMTLCLVSVSGCQAMADPSRTGPVLYALLKHTVLHLAKSQMCVYCCVVILVSFLCQHF